MIREFPISVLRTDGGMVENDLLMQFQADILDRDVVRPRVKETTALGAAYAAGLATGFFSGTEELTAQWAVDRTWHAQMAKLQNAKRSTGFGRKQWSGRSTGWIELCGRDK